jgi:hypothetical protein
MSDWEPKIVSFLCNWCSYGAADLAGVSRMEYPSNIRVIRIPCTGRMRSEVRPGGAQGRGRCRLGVRVTSGRMPLPGR